MASHASQKKVWLINWVNAPVVPPFWITARLLLVHGIWVRIWPFPEITPGVDSRGPPGARSVLDYEKTPFFLRDSRASETRARVKITPCEKRRHAQFLAWGDFHARSRFARSLHYPWGKMGDYSYSRSVQPKFPQISVQNSMDRFGPTGKVFEKTGPPFEVDHFSRSDWSELWLNESRPGIKFCFVFCILPSFVLFRVTFSFIINVSRKRLNSILRARVACSSTRKPRNTLNCI